MTTPMSPIVLFHELNELMDALGADEFGARMAYTVAIDLCDGMFKGKGGADVLRGIYEHYIKALEDNAQAADFPGEREAYTDIIAYVREVSGLST